MDITLDQLKELTAEAAREAVKAINPPNPAEVPGQSTKALGANVNLKRYNPFPSFKASVMSLKNGSFPDGRAFEADFVQAAKEALPWTGPNDPEDEFVDTRRASSSLIWPKDLTEARAVFEHMAEKAAVKAIDRIDAAVKSIDGSYKANTEAVTSTFTAGTAGGYLVPPQFLNSLFSYALAPKVALRNVPGITVVPVNGVTFNLPREGTRAGASEAAEAGTLSAQDPAFSLQTVTVKKQYAFRRWSNELAADSEPAFATFLNRTLSRDLAIEQDSEYLTGSGSGNHITGITAYSGLTTGPNLGTNGRTVKFDDFMDAVYLLEDANADTNSLFAIWNPRVTNTLRKEKDNEGRYVVSQAPIPWGAAGTPTKVLGGIIPYTTTTTLSRTQSVGSSTDCTTAIVGDASNVFILERQGIEIFFTEHLYAATDEIGVRATTRSTIVILQPTAVLLMSGIRP